MPAFDVPLKGRTLLTFASWSFAEDDEEPLARDEREDALVVVRHRDRRGDGGVLEPLAALCALHERVQRGLHLGLGHAVLHPHDDVARPAELRPGDQQVLGVADWIDARALEERLPLRQRGEHVAEGRSGVVPAQAVAVEEDLDERILRAEFARSSGDGDRVLQRGCRALRGVQLVVDVVRFLRRDRRGPRRGVGPCNGRPRRRFRAGPGGGRRLRGRGGRGYVGCARRLGFEVEIDRDEDLLALRLPGGGGRRGVKEDSRKEERVERERREVRDHRDHERDGEPPARAAPERRPHRRSASSPRRRGRGAGALRGRRGGGAHGRYGTHAGRQSQA